MFSLSKTVEGGLCFLPDGQLFTKSSPLVNHLPVTDCLAMNACLPEASVWMSHANSP